jgi:hypothetical protein
MPFREVSDLDISITKNAINKLHTVSCVPLKTEQPLSKILLSETKQKSYFK